MSELGGNPWLDLAKDDSRLQPGYALVPLRRPEKKKVESDWKGNRLSQSVVLGVSQGQIFSGSTFDGINLANADLYRGMFAKSTIKGGDFSGANLKDADFSGAKLVGVDFSGADLAGANLAGADLTGADLSNANLAGADLTGAKIKNAFICNTSMDGVKIDKTVREELQRIREAMREVDLTKIDLKKVNLRYVDLRSLDLRGVDFTGVDLTGVNLVGVNLTGAKIDPSFLDGTKLFTRSANRKVDIKKGNLSGLNLTEANAMRREMAEDARRIEQKNEMQNLAAQNEQQELLKNEDARREAVMAAAALRARYAEKDFTPNAKEGLASNYTPEQQFFADFAKYGSGGKADNFTPYRQGVNRPRKKVREEDYVKSRYDFPQVHLVVEKVEESRKQAEVEIEKMKQQEGVNTPNTENLNPEAGQSDSDVSSGRRTSKRVRGRGQRQKVRS